MGGRSGAGVDDFGAVFRQLSGLLRFECRGPDEGYDEVGESVFAQTGANFIRTPKYVGYEHRFHCGLYGFDCGDTGLRIFADTIAELFGGQLHHGLLLGLPQVDDHQHHFAPPIQQLGGLYGRNSPIPTNGAVLIWGRDKH